MHTQKSSGRKDTLHGSGSRGGRVPSTCYNSGCHWIQELVTWAIANQKEECQNEKFDSVQLHLKVGKTENYKQSNVEQTLWHWYSCWTQRCVPKCSTVDWIGIHIWPQPPAIHHLFSDRYLSGADERTDQCMRSLPPLFVQIEQINDAKYESTANKAWGGAAQ